MVYLPWLYNAALFWDVLAGWTFTTTKFFRESPVQYRWLGLLILFIWMSIWLITNGPMRVPFIRWRFFGGRLI